MIIMIYQSMIFTCVVIMDFLESDEFQNHVSLFYREDNMMLSRSSSYKST